ncbi:MAG: single-stranded-DNA-specific exonuclease RecJ [Parcubacteria group bacterium]
MHFPDLFEKLLSARNIGSDEKETFLNPDYAGLHNPLLMPDMERARDRIIEAMEKKEHIVVYSDYDADGIPGAVVLSDFFKRAKYENVSFYIPHRHDEGFGLNIDALEECLTRGTKLLITIDCGTADIKEVKHISEKGVDVIITDHHEQKEILPPAFAVVNPKRKDSKYPYKDLCGSGVAFKLVQAILEKERFGIKEGMEKWSLDMVAIATLSDMVPLRGENRILARYGLEVLRKSPRPGLLALFKNLRMNQKYLTEDDIAFMITPRINAASRMGTPEDAFKLLATTDPVEAEALAAHLEEINNKRKVLVASVVKDAKRHLKEREIKKVIVIGNPEWRPALLGLVANSLVEDYDRPVFVWGRDGDGVLKGSCRSNGKVNLHSLMSRAGESFIEYGGHSQAGGFSATLENISLLEDALSEAYPETDDHDVRLAGDPLEINIEDVCEDLWKTVSLFSPFGMDNEKPIFKINAEVKGVKQFGKAKEHLEVVFNCPKRDVKAVGFFTSSDKYTVPVETGSKVSLLAHMEKSYFMNRPELRLRIVDITA